MKSIYRICDVFQSLQGEGRYVGAPALFIRLSGCNKSCSFCDEPMHSDKSQIIFEGSAFDNRLEDILPKPKLSKAPISHIVITGGEPTIYNLSELINMLRQRYASASIAVETNGYKIANATLCDLITLSPKSRADFSTTLYELINSKLLLKCEKLDIKVVVGEKVNQWFIELLEGVDSEATNLFANYLQMLRSISIDTRIYLSAVNFENELDIQANSSLAEKLINLRLSKQLITYHKNIFLSIQTHKILQVK